MKLFCLPFAGGSAAFYNSWRRLINNHIELRPVELPGRGIRFSEPFYRSIQEASIGILSDIEEELLSSPYALFGHSMGADIVFRLLELIRQHGLPEPERVFFSGRKPPHLCEYKDYKSYSDEEFLCLLKEYGGTPQDFFEDPSLVSLYLPIIKNDFLITDENHFNTHEIQPFNVSFTILIGEEDDVLLEDAAAWSRYSTQKCSVLTFPGGHFFIEESKGKLIEIMNESLLALNCK